MSEASIQKVRIAAAHDGAAELVVSIVHDNGAVSDITLDGHAGAFLMESCAAHDPEDLVGQPWTVVKKALSAAYNRYNR